MFKRRSDTELAQRIMRELKWDSRINWARINVDVKNGVATLTGAVPTYLQKLEAQNAAHRVLGMLDVAK